MSKSTEQPGSYSSEIRQLAYAMESMSHVEKCAALYDLSEKQHHIGMKNGRFGYISKHDFDQELAKRVESAFSDISTEASDYKALGHRFDYEKAMKAYIITLTKQNTKENE